MASNLHAIDATCRCLGPPRWRRAPRYRRDVSFLHRRAPLGLELALRPGPTTTARLQGGSAPLPRRERRVVGLGDGRADAEAAQNRARGERDQARAANRGRGGLVGGVAPAPGRPPPAAPERISSRHAGALGLAAVCTVGSDGLAERRLVRNAHARGAVTISIHHRFAPIAAMACWWALNHLTPSTRGPK